MAAAPCHQGFLNGPLQFSPPPPTFLCSSGTLQGLRKKLQGRAFAACVGRVCSVPITWDERGRKTAGIGAIYIPPTQAAVVRLWPDLGGCFPPPLPQCSVTPPKSPPPLLMLCWQSPIPAWHTQLEHSTKSSSSISVSLTQSNSYNVYSVELATAAELPF